MKNKGEKLKAHQKYLNNEGHNLIGVTTVIKNLGWNTDVLVAWARREALAGNDPDKIRDNSANIGTCAHYLCECEAVGIKPILDDYSKNVIEAAQKCFQSYMDWKKSQGIKNIKHEIQLVSEKYQYGGTIDMLYQKDGKWILGDIKTSSGVYAEAKVQVAAYRQLLIENGYKVDEVYILHLDKNGGFTPYKIEKLDIYWQIFANCLNLEKLKKLA